MKSKEELRKLLEGRKRDTTEATSVRIVEQLITILKSSDIHSILLYQAIEKWGEIDISSLPGLLPDIHFDTVANVKDAPFPTEKYDAVIVPLLGFNQNGYRLGHGGGWYDRFLKTQPQALKIGIGYKNTLVGFRAEIHDQRMDIIITEKCVYNFRPRE